MNNQKYSEEYAEKLRDPRWQKKRLEIFSRDGWKCVLCKDRESTLHVHHLFYFYKKEPWDIVNGFLITVCENCHKAISKIKFTVTTLIKKGEGNN